MLRRVQVPSGSRFGVTTIIRSLDMAGVRLTDIALRQPTLDDAFLILTGHDVTRHIDQEVAS